MACFQIVGRFSATADSGLALPKDRCCSRDPISITARCVEHPSFCLLFLLLRCSSSTVTTMIIVPETPSIVAGWRGAGLTRPSLRLIQWSTSIAPCEASSSDLASKRGRSSRLASTSHASAGPRSPRLVCWSPATAVETVRGGRGRSPVYGGGGTNIACDKKNRLMLQLAAE